MLTSWSWKKWRRIFGKRVDRFSNIPDDVVHEILSFLTIKDIACMSLVSKRFRQLCLYVPDLFLDFDSPSLRKMGYWTETFLILRNGTKLRRFVLSQINEYRESEGLIHVCKWIHNAVVIGKAEELDLSFRMRQQEFSLPLSTFLRAIKLDLFRGILSLKLPSSTTTSSFSSLQVLEIKGMTLDHNLSEDWVSSLFPAIKKLKLENVEVIKNLNITSSSLECLSISCIKTYGLQNVVVLAERLQTLCVTNYPYRPYSDKWLIYAPSLRKCRWTGEYVNYCCSQVSVMFLESVSIESSEPIMRNPAKKNWFELLRFISHAKSVALKGTRILEILSKGDSLAYMWPSLAYIPDPLPYMLDSVQNIDLQVAQMPAVASFFKRVPNLKTLRMRYIGVYYYSFQSTSQLALKTHDFDIEYWESQNLPFIYQLKEAEIEIYIQESEVGLIKYLIKHAKALDKLSFTFSSRIDIRKSRQIRKKLSEFYQTSLDATFDFVLK